MYALLLTRDADEKAVLSVVLQRVGLAVTAANDLDRALRAWSDRPADLIFLAFREYDPLDAARRIRATTSVPLVVIVTQPNEDLHYQLLAAGVDQVISRPFSARLLIAQARALLRRARGTPVFSLPTLTQGDITLDPATRIAHIAGQSSKRLTHLEFRLLYTLMMHRNQILPTETIVEQVWGYSDSGDKDLVRGLVRRLRAKVEPDRRNPCYILTVPGVGYSFQPTEES